MDRKQRGLQRTASGSAPAPAGAERDGGAVRRSRATVFSWP